MPIEDCNLQPKDFVPYWGFEMFSRRTISSLNNMIDSGQPDIVKKHAEKSIRNCSRLARYNLVFTLGLACGALKGIEWMLYK